MTFKEVPVAKSWPPSIHQKECIKCVCCDMYSTQTYIIILWWQLRYMSVICVIWYKIFSLSKLLGGSDPPSPPPSSVCHWLAKTVNSAFNFEVNICGMILHMDPDTFYFYFYNMNFNIHALEKISAYFSMAHTHMIVINFRWPTPSTVLKNSDPPPIFPSPPFYFMTGPSLKWQ
jgi:hypothetical protein